MSAAQAAGAVREDALADVGMAWPLMRRMLHEVGERLGHRGRGALASTLLGSVGLACVLHATCPVTIVRPD